jgi:1-deoxy-D-xylulose-5-phosphate synthase
MTLLDKINSPSDLKKISSVHLPELCGEIREEIIKIVSETGGHLASNLGVVELTVALHYVFNMPEDKIIWDVGHQCYTHKLITGRREKFSTLRQWKGISGFPKREESPYDVFDTGHSGTSISAALGMAEGMRLLNKKAKTLAVIGDGSLTNGMAFEALNHAGSLKRDMIVVLNDNKMSISPNVGAFSGYLNRIITGKFYQKAREQLQFFIKSVPGLGTYMLKFAVKIEEAVKSIIVPGVMFEELGFKYVGPIRGHNLNDLIATFKAVKSLKGPFLVHVVTKKGKGFSPAEKDSPKYHSASPFDLVEGKIVNNGDSGEETFSSVFGRKIVKLAQDNNKIVAITAAMPDGVNLIEFAEKFPDRFYDVGIAEEHAVTMAAGMAAQGLIPIVAIYSTFMQRAYDQILHDICLQNLGVILMMDRAGIVGPDGPTHHGLFDISFLRNIPNLAILAPKDAEELRDMMEWALSYKKPAAIRYPKGKIPDKKLFSDYKTSAIKLGQAEVVREGNDLAILTVGLFVYTAFNIAEKLSKDGINSAVINMRFVKPIDKKLILKLIQEKNIKNFITLEEGAVIGGLGSAVLEMVSDMNLKDIRIKRLGLPDEFIEHGQKKIILDEYSLNEDKLYKIIKEFMSSRT